MSEQKESLFAKPATHLAVYAIGIIAIFVGHKIAPTNLAGPGLDFVAFLISTILTVFFFLFFWFNILPYKFYSHSSKTIILVIHGIPIFALIMTMLLFTFKFI